MEDSVKIKLASTAVEIILTHGLPAVLKLFSTLNDKEVVTLEDIKSVRGELDSASYFSPREDNVN